MAAASKTDRVAWAFNEQGRRNIWVAEAPAFAARKLTAYDHDDGQELTRQVPLPVFRFFRVPAVSAAEASRCTSRHC